MKYLMILVVFWTVAASAAYAQHADIRPRVADDRIVTDGFIDSLSETIPNLRVFGYDFGEDPEEPFFAADPGVNAAAGSGLPGGSNLAFNVLSGADFDLPSNLSYWDGNDADLDLPGVQVSFGTVPGSGVLHLSLDAANVTIGNSLGQQSGFTIQTVLASGAVHRHLSSEVEASPAPANGVYLAALELTSSASNVADSLPLFLVYNLGLDEETHDLAMDYVTINYAFTLGDMNGDNLFDNQDIFPFVTALTDPDEYLNTWGFESYQRRGDMNGDHLFDNEDIDGFVNGLVGGSGAPMAPVPEPSSALLLIVGAALLGCKRLRRGRRPGP